MTLSRMLLDFVIEEDKDYHNSKLPTELMEYIKNSDHPLDTIEDGPVMFQILTKYVPINEYIYRVRYILHFDTIKNDIDSGFGVIFNFRKTDIPNLYN